MAGGARRARIVERVQSAPGAARARAAARSAAERRGTGGAGVRARRGLDCVNMAGAARPAGGAAESGPTLARVEAHRARAKVHAAEGTPRARRGANVRLVCAGRARLAPWVRWEAGVGVRGVGARGVSARGVGARGARAMGARETRAVKPAAHRHAARATAPGSARSVAAHGRHAVLPAVSLYESDWQGRQPPEALPPRRRCHPRTRCPARTRARRRTARRRASPAARSGRADTRQCARSSSRARTRRSESRRGRARQRRRARGRPTAPARNLLYGGGARF